jgi:chemotaxis protein CheD
MVEPYVALPEVHVQPGESCLVRTPSILRTILGSCVGITFWSPELGIGALCHPMLPRCPVKPAAGMGVDAGRRYVDFAIRDLAQRFQALHAQCEDIEVKLFGGGDVLLVSNKASRPTVGNLNCEVALDTLQEQGFTVAASSLGGKSGLNIQFHTGTGEVLLRRLH